MAKQRFCVTEAKNIKSASHDQKVFGTFDNMAEVLELENDDVADED